MPAYVKVSGAWKQATTAPACYVKVSGVWKKCSQVYVRVDGRWKGLFSIDEEESVIGPKWHGDVVTLKNVKIGSNVKVKGYIYVLNTMGGWKPTVWFKATGATPSERTISVDILLNNIDFDFTATSSTVTIERYGQVVGGDTNESPSIETHYITTSYS